MVIFYSYVSLPEGKHTSSLRLYLPFNCIKDLAPGASANSWDWGQATLEES